MTLVHGVLLVLSSVLVAGLAWKLCEVSTARLGALLALVLFLVHPAFRQSLWTVSSWDAFFGATFFLLWAFTAHWSAFMRSWLLAGLYAFGLWVGSALVFWIPVALVFWTLRSRRREEALISSLTVVFGGFFFFALLWGAHWLIGPASDRPSYFRWVRWSLPTSVPGSSLAWILLVVGAVIEPIRVAFQEKRSSVSFALALMVILLALFGTPDTALAYVALATPLIAVMLARREFLYPRVVRWTVALTALAAATILLSPKIEWQFLLFGVVVITGATIGILRHNQLLSWRTAVEATCLGIFLGEAIGSCLWR